MKKILFLSILFFSCFVIQVQSQVTVTIGTGTEEGRYNPIYTYYGYNYTQQIYTSAELNAAGAVAGMQINAIRFYWTGAGSLNNCNVWTVYMGETTQSSFTSNTSWVPYASLTEVYTGTVTLPANAGWFTITLTNPVTWNGGNIVVAIDENVPGYGPSATRWQATITANNTAIYYYSDNTNPDPSTPPSGTTTTTRPNIQFEMASLIPCAGDPDPGTATISSDTGCPGATITLSSTDATVGSGITYIWQSSPNPDGPWTDVPNGSNLTCATNTNSITYYRLRIHCANSGLWGTSNVVSYSPDGDVCLCGEYPAVYASSTSDEDISNITVGGWSNDSDCSTTAPGPGSINKRYANYVGTSVGGPIVMQGETVNFSLTQTSCGTGSYNNGFQLYIDWNMDGDFQDAGEQVYNQPTSASGNHTKTGTFTVPTTATPGTTRMRAVVVETSFPTSTNYAHTSYSWGETEDYCITIIPATPCDGEPTTGTASISTDVGCPGQTFTLSAPDATLAAGITYIWQSSPNPDGPWTDVPNGANMYCSTSTTTLTYYRFRVHCANSGLWGTSNVVSYSPDGDVCLCGNYPENYASSTSDEDISNITVGGWSNDSDCSTTAPGPGSINKRYANYVGTSVGGPVVMQGETVNFSLTQTSCGTYDYGNGFQLYIDWNMDGDFLDAGEQVYNQPTSASGNHTKTGTFTVPTTATPGTTRMRAVVVETSFPTSTNYAHTSYSWGETEDYCITIIPATPCDGEPTTGTASISTDVGCPGQTFTLSSTGATLAAGITYIWQSSPNPDGPWTDVPNGSNLYCSTNTFTITYYRLRIHCANSGLWATSNVVSYTPEGEVCLCGDYPALYANYTGDEEISNVTIGGWSNNSDCSTTAPGPGSINKRYSNYTGITGPTVMQGETVNFSLTQTSCGTGSYNNGFQLYVDWNMDGDFQDAGEQVYNQPTATSGNHTKTGTFTVPMTAIPGTTRMRVVNVETTFPTSTNYAHSTYGYGETEDYCITIIPAVDCNDMPVAGTATPASQVVPSGGSATITLSGSTIAAGLSYQWQRATSPTGPFTDIAGATLPSYNTGALTTSYYYRCIVTCVATGDAATSTDAFVEVIQSYNMSNTTITTCNALFYDSGGPTGNYSSSQNLTLIIMPEVVGGNVIVTFNSFSLEGNNYDKLFIYNGNSTTAPLIGQYTGSTSPGTVTSTAADGSLTFRFTSDGSVQYAGWEALISCSDPCNYVYETPTFDQVGPFCSGWEIPDLPTTSNNGYEGTWTPAIDNTATTTYTFTPNENQCATPTTMTIVVNPNNPASFTQYSSYCRGDSIPELPTISNDGIEGTWSPAINNWNTTEYTFVTNDGTCAWTTMEIEIDTVPAEIINNSGSNELNCDLTAIYLTAEGGVSYSWDGVYFNTFQGKTITDPGTYTVIVRDANSCTGEASIEITQNLNPPVATITNNTGSDYLNCHINEISLTASGGATYTWNGGSSPNSATNTFNTEGTYYVTVTADNGCDTIIYYMITDETILDITENITSPSCFGMTGSAEIIINSGGQAPFIIEWTDGVTTFSRTNIPTNTPFGYIITDADNCSTIRSLTITTPEQIQVNFVSDSVSCYGGHDGSLDISNSTGGVPPYSYQWSVAGGTGSQITGLAAGTYFVTISDAKNCTASGSHSVGQPEQISIDMQITDAICGQTGGAINAEATGGVGGFTYEWSTSSISNNITGLTPNMYTLTVTDANNCTQTASATVDKTGDIIANITVVQPILCGGNPDAILQGSSANGAMPLTFNWSNSATSEIINNLAVGTYMLTVTDAWGCTGSTEETLEAAIDVSINSNVSHVKCYGNNDGKINIGILSGEPPFTIAWSNDSTELNQSSLPAGLYSVTITDNRDCAITENFEIIEPPVLELAFTKKDVSCYSDLNGTITMNVTGGTEPYTYSITTPRNQVVTNTASANNLSIGKYIMKVVDNNGCTDIKETNIYQPAKLSAKVNVTNPSCMGNDDGSIIVTPFGGTSPYRYTYDNFDLDTNIIVNAKEGRYSIEVEDANSCKLILSDIYVGDGLLPCLKIPNAFTPNGDGINETWIIENIDLYPDAQIFVYTRWGEQIYYGTPKSDPWNGTYNGKKMPTGAYLYIVETRNNDAGVYKGTVTIVY